MVSESFNFITVSSYISRRREFLLFQQEHETLIYIFLSLAYAMEETVGFNTNMKMIEVPSESTENRIQYQIIFNNKTLSTTSKPLSDFKADFFMGRATRVFKVFGEQTSPFVLRMSWLPIKCVMEHERLEEINKAVNALGPNQPYGLDPTQYWLTVVLYGYNTFHRDGWEIIDSTNLFAREDFEVHDFYPGYTELKDIVPLKTIKGVRPDSSTGHIHEEKLLGSDSGLLDSPYTGDAKSYHLSHNIPRVHYLIGYKEICKPLHAQRVLHDIYFALADAVFGKSQCLRMI